MSIVLNDKFLAKMLPASYNQLFIAYSGGRDSTILLHLARYLPRVQAVHVNHGYSLDSDNWQEFCCQYATSLGLNCIAYKLDKKIVKNREASWRRARYNFFFSLLQDYPMSVLCTAHHQQDQSESLLLALLRGSSVRGLAGIYESIKIKGYKQILRPLLSVEDDVLQAYAIKHKLQYLKDPSNEDISFKRNAVRAYLIPAFKKLDKSACRKIAESAKWAHEAAFLLEQYLDKKLATMLNNDHSISLHMLQNLSHIKRKWVLAYWMKKYWQISLPSNQLQKINQRLALIDKNRSYQLNNNLALAIKGDQLTIAKEEAMQELKIAPVKPDLAEVAAWFYSQGINLTVEDIAIRKRLPGDRCLPNYRQHSQTIKKILQELKVSRPARASIWIIYNSTTFKILAVYPIFLCK